MRAILFDLDGTLLDHDAAAAAACVAWARENDLDGTDEQVISRWSVLERRWFAAYERGETDHLGQRVERARGFLGRPGLTRDEALGLYARYLELYQENWTAFPDAHSCLVRALNSGRPVGVLTNGRSEMQAAKLEATGLALPGLVLLATVDAGVPKPDPRAFTGALERLGAEEGVMIGDNPVTDVRAAVDAGLSAVLLDRSCAGAGRDRARRTGRAAETGHDDLPAEAFVIGGLDELNFTRA